MKQHAAVAIRPLEEKEISLLEDYLPGKNFKKHRVRFEEQNAGDALYLIAWEEGIPVGHLLIKWNGARQEQVRSVIHDCPHLEDLYVVKEKRRQGIATSLMKEAEKQSIEKGNRQLGFAVSFTNRKARKLYGKLHYLTSQIEPYWVSWTYLDRNGNEKKDGAMCEYFLKQLL